MNNDKDSIYNRIVAIHDEAMKALKDCTYPTLPHSIPKTIQSYL